MASILLGLGSRQDRFVLLYLGFVMLMGLQRRACSCCNQLAAPVDVLLIRLFTLHRGARLWDMRLGLSLDQLQEALAPPGLTVPLIPHKQEAGVCTDCAITFQPPAQPLPLRSVPVVPSHSLLRGCPHPRDRQDLVWAAPGLENVSCRMKASSSHLSLPIFSKEEEPERGKGQEFGSFQLCFVGNKK